MRGRSQAGNRLRPGSARQTRGVSRRCGSSRPETIRATRSNRDSAPFVVEHGDDALAAQQLCEVLALLAAGIAFPGAEHDLHGADLTEQRFVVEIGQVIGRIVEGAVFVVAVEKGLDVEDTAYAEEGGTRLGWRSAKAAA